MSFKSKTILATAILGAVALTTPTWAGPVLTLDLTDTAGNHNVTATASTPITLNIWVSISNDASFSGPTTFTNAQLSSIAARFVSVEGSTSITGNYSAATIANNAIWAQPNVVSGITHNPYDASGGLDWGGPIPAPGSNTNYFVTSAPTGASFDVNGRILLGTIVWTPSVVNAGGSTVLKALPKVVNTNSASSYDFTDGTNATHYLATQDPVGSVTPVATPGPTWYDGGKYDGAAFAGRVLDSVTQRIRVGQGVTVTTGAGPTTDTITLNQNPTGTVVTEGTGPFDNSFPSGNGAPPNPVAVGTAGTGLAAGSLHIVDLTQTGDVYVLVRLTGGKTLANLTHLPSGFTAVDLTQPNLGTLGLDWKGLMAAYNNFANVGFKFTAAPGAAANDYFVWDLSADSAAIDQIVAVPEPASLGLVGVGVLSLLLRRRRK